jgi:hypothetical protein
MPMRSTAASLPGSTTVLSMTWWSYCSQIQRREQMLGLASSSRKAARSLRSLGQIELGEADRTPGPRRGTRGAPSRVVDGRVVRERGGGHVGNDLVAFAHDEAAGVGDRCR